MSMTSSVRFPAAIALFAAMAASPSSASGERTDASADGTRANFALAETFSYRSVQALIYGADSVRRDDGSRGSMDKRKYGIDKRLVKPNWIGQTDRFWYYSRVPGGYRYYLVDASRRKKDVLVDAAALARRIETTFGEKVDLAGKPLNILAVDDAGKRVDIELAGKVITYDRNSGAISRREVARRPKPPSAEYSVSPDGKFTVYAKDHNLFAIGPDGVDRQLSTDGEPWYSYSVQEGSFDSQKPLQYHLGWFNHSNKFYVERWDNRKVGDLWFVDSTSQPRPTMRSTKFAMPGEENVPIQQLSIFDLDKQTEVRVDTAKWEGQAIGNIDLGEGVYVAKDDSRLYFYRLNRGSTEVELVAADPQTGRTTVLIHEKSEPYFSIRYPQSFVINGGKEIIWGSDRSGWNHYYLHDGTGKFKRPITSGRYMAEEIIHIDERKRLLTLMAFGVNEAGYPFHRQYYKISLDGGEPVALTPEDATHHAYFSASRNYFVDNVTRADQAPYSVLRDGNGRIIMKLEELDVSRLRAAGFKMPEYFSVKAADDETDLHGVMWKPADFDAELKYPIIAYVQPNPALSEANFAEFKPTYPTVALAQLGFIVVELRTRGQGMHVREKAIVTHSFGDARDYPLADAKSILEQLAGRHRFIDLTRAGVVGHSGGGFMAAALCMTYPQLFKACIASSGNHVNLVAEQNSSEFHWGVKGVRKTREDGGVYVDWIADIASNEELAPNLQAPLLLIHGDNDTDTPFHQSVRLADALIKAHKRFDFMIMPGKNHEYGEYRDYFERLRWAYFAEHLLGDDRDMTDLSALGTELQ